MSDPSMQRASRLRLTAWLLSFVGLALLLVALFVVGSMHMGVRSEQLGVYEHLEDGLSVVPVYGAARPPFWSATYDVTIKDESRFGVYRSERVTIATTTPPSAEAQAEVLAALGAYLTEHGVSQAAIDAGGKLVWELSVFGVLWRLVVLLASVWLLWHGNVLSARAKRLKAGLCAFCAYQLTGEDVCPECGRATG